MPRDLTDLMERATAVAPAETHAAGDITRRAQRAQRRRTQGIVAGLAVVALAAGGIGYGTTRARGDRVEQPASPYQTGVHQSLARAVAADTAPGLTMLDYGVPSYADLGKGLLPAPRYADVDASGRLFVQDPTSGSTTYELFSSPSGPPAAVTPPALGIPSTWLAHVSFTGAGGLAWQSPDTGTLNYALTDLQGGHTVPVRNDLSGIPGRAHGGGHPARDVWYADGRVWFTAVTSGTKSTAPRAREYVSLFSIDPAQPSVVRAEKAMHALQMDVAGGEAVWLDGSTVHALDLSTGEQRTVPVPGGAACAVAPASAYIQGNLPGTVATNGRLVSLVQSCSGYQRLLVFDLDGRLVKDIESFHPGYVTDAGFSGELLTFQGQSAAGTTAFADDLTTGELVALGTGTQPPPTAPRAAGHYVLWYDDKGAHVARLSD